MTGSIMRICVVLLLAVIAANASRIATPSTHRNWLSELPRRALENRTVSEDQKQFISCSPTDVLFVIESSAKELMKKFDGAMKDVKLIARMLVQSNQKGGEANPVISEDMCCCNTPDWKDLGRSSAWAGFHDCNPQRSNELFFGNQSIRGGYGVFTGTRTIDTDLAWLSPASTIFPWVVERQTVSFDRDGFYVAAWIGTSGEVWSYYPGFNQIWPDHYFGDYIGGDYNGRDDVFVKLTLPAQNPTRKPLWTRPYIDPAGAGSMISAITPVWFDGQFRGHTFRDEYVASTGIDILLIYMENLVAAVKPSATALPMVVDDEGHLVSAPVEVVEAIFGKGVTLENTIQCAGQDSDAISQQTSSCKIMSSSTGDWALLMQQIQAQPRGQRRLLGEQLRISVQGEEVMHHAAVFRWAGEDTPLWNSVVLVPVSELDGAGRWAAPEELSAATDDDAGQVELELTLENSGSVDLLYRIKWLPEFASVQSTTPPSSAADGAAVSLPARQTVTFNLLLEASKTSGRGTHSQTLAWELLDDNYPDCALQNEVSVVINLVVDPPSNSWVTLTAAVVASVVALGIVAFLYVNWKRRQADAVWSIKLQDLHFKTDPPEVLGRGTYGLVVAGEYRKTMVAVKRVIPPESAAGLEAMSSLFGLGTGKPKGTQLLNQLFMHKSSTASMSPVSQPRSVAGRTPVSASKPIWGNPHDGGSVGYASFRGAQSERSVSVQSQTPSATLSQTRVGEGSRCLWRVLPCCFSQHHRLRQAFIEEMRHVSKMRHPCITTVMGAVIEKKCEPMLVMELMEHGSLFDLIHNRTVEFSGELVIPILRHVAQGLTFLHQHPIVHGDVKAANVLVDAQFRGKVTDFSLTAKKYAASGPCGTPFWMAPELLRGDMNTTHSDVYAFGITVWEVYARTDPYADEDPETVLEQVADASAAVDTNGRSTKRPRIPDDCPLDVQRIMRECWHSDPSCRPACEEVDRMLKTLDTQTMGPASAGGFGRVLSADGPAPGGRFGRCASSGVRTLLHDVFPKRIAEKLVAGQKVPAEHHDEVTIFFSDIVGFTDIAASLSGVQVSEMLDRLYTQFDELSQRHGVFKVETIGDAYMAVTNLEDGQARDHAIRIASFAADAIQAAASTLVDPENPDMGSINIRVGFHTGPVVANVVGTRNPRFCLFGDTVNTASRMESNSRAGQIHCSERAANILKKQLYDCKDTDLVRLFDIESRGDIQVKGKGRMATFWVARNRPVLPMGPVELSAPVAMVDSSGMVGNDAPHRRDSSLTAGMDSIVVKT